ncbi:MAG: hypothetical protein ACR2PO_21170 [Methyloligellaceae bacterium]
MTTTRILRVLLAGVVALLALETMVRPVQAACVIPNSACYPWRIKEGAQDTELLKVIPNNAVTSAVYRVCLCPPNKSVSLVFDFYEKNVTVGAVEVDGDDPICRDFRIETSRRSRLLLRRAEGTEQAVDGCYTSSLGALP